MRFIVGLLVFCVWGHTMSLRATEIKPEEIGGGRYVPPCERTQKISLKVEETLEDKNFRGLNPQSLIDYTLHIEGIGCRWHPSQKHVAFCNGSIVHEQQCTNPKVRISLDYLGNDTQTSFVVPVPPLRLKRSYKLLITLQKELDVYTLDMCHFELS